MVWCEQRLRLWKSGRSVRHLDTLMTRNCPNFGVHLPEDSESLPVQFKPKFRLEKTNLLARVVEKWDEIPVGFLQHLDLRKSVYGYIGLEDYTLFPLIRPGSLVELTQIKERSAPRNGIRSSTVPSTSWNCEMVMFAVGVSWTGGS